MQIIESPIRFSWKLRVKVLLSMSKNMRRIVVDIEIEIERF